MKVVRIWAGALVATAGASLAVSATSCQQQPVNVPVRTFDSAQKMDVVCLKVSQELENGALVPIAPVPEPLERCAPYATNVDISRMPYHMHAVVTQTARGELGVVDLTAGVVLDQDVATPGTTFLPVGALPTDVAAMPDGKMVFVSAAEPNKPALYGIPGERLRGPFERIGPGAEAADASTASSHVGEVATLASWPVCLLPGAPSSIFVAARADPAAGSDVVVVLPGDEVTPASVMTIDAQAFVDGRIRQGALEPCPAVPFPLSSAVPPTFERGPAWDDGIPYADGNMSQARPPPAARCTPAAGGGAGGGTNGGSPAAAGDGGTYPMPVAREPARAAAAALDVNGQTLYIADLGLPIVHVLDLSRRDAPRELAPLVATSLAEPSRKVVVGAVAVSPATRAYKKYLYAVDQGTGGILVYDVTDPASSPRTPLTRPNAEVNPFLPPDRIEFSAPVVSLAFAKHDWPLQYEQGDAGVRRNATLAGALCNPSPKAGTFYTANDFVEPGAFYRANAPFVDVALGPGRLRGIFNFATLSNGQVVVIDVDDWDAPCRRPDPVTRERLPTDLFPPQPDAAEGDRDPYHAPLAHTPNQGDTTPVSLESFYPVVQPHRARSLYLLRADPSSGTHVPTLLGTPQLFTETALLATTGAESSRNPTLLPTVTPFEDPTYVNDPTTGDPAKRSPAFPPGSTALSLPTEATPTGVRFSWEDPLVHADQDWAVTYEGAIPGFDGVRANVELGPARYQSLVLRAETGAFCRRGVEDARMTRERVEQATQAAAQSGLSLAPRADTLVGDYVQLTDEILPQEDPYWTLDLSPGSGGADGCWEEREESSKTAAGRHKACLDVYGAAGDQNISRDFPILEAYDDHLVIGRYGVPAGATMSTANRDVVGPHPSNESFMKQLRCCFHSQVAFRVRTGGQWVATGSNAGYLHHVRPDPAGGNACVSSCESRDALLNARSFEVLRPAGTAASLPGRNSPLAMRNPMFSYVTWAGNVPVGTAERTVTKRGWAFRFSTRGQYTPLSIALSPQSTSVNPRSMRFLPTLDQVAVVDGASQGQGLVLISLRSVTLAGSFF